MPANEPTTDRAATGTMRSAQSTAAGAPSTNGTGAGADTILRVEGLKMHFPITDGIILQREVGKVRKQWKDGFFVVPGLRLNGHANGNGNHADQKRVVTPREARNDGASVLVVGRPISRADDPVAAARAIEATL